jgi:hypothetical protein
VVQAFAATAARPLRRLGRRAGRGRRGAGDCRGPRLPGKPRGGVGNELDPAAAQVGRGGPGVGPLGTLRL